MSDLISRQAAIDAMRELPYGYRGIVWDILNSLPSTKPRTCEFWDDESNFCALHRPSAQPERKKGKWLCSDDLYETAICSCCQWDSGEAYLYGQIWNFCPNCGADLRGDQDE